MTYMSWPTINPKDHLNAVFFMSMTFSLHSSCTHICAYINTIFEISLCMCSFYNPTSLITYTPGIIKVFKTNILYVIFPRLLKYTVNVNLPGI